MPVNMPTHAHGHGYSDLNFLIPELVSGVQFSKGPYFADQGDFATAGAANINYANALDRPIVPVGGGDEGFGRLFAASPRVGAGHLLAALEVEHNDGPWTLATTTGRSTGSSATARATRSTAFRSPPWVTGHVELDRPDSAACDRRGPDRPLRQHRSDRRRQHVSLQRIARVAADARAMPPTEVTVYGSDTISTCSRTSPTSSTIPSTATSSSRPTIDSSPARGQSPPAGRWGVTAVQNTFGVQLRNDDITNVGLYRTQARQVLDTTRQDAVVQTSGGGSCRTRSSGGRGCGRCGVARGWVSVRGRREATRRTAARPAPASPARRAAVSGR